VGQLISIQKLTTISLLDLKLWKIKNLGESLFSVGVKSCPKKQSMYVSTVYVLLHMQSRAISALFYRLIHILEMFYIAQKF
jgi:hypothetical protein